MRIAVEGCCHGRLDEIYAAIAADERRSGAQVDLLLICGDFQAVRNAGDLACLNCPDKYKEMNSFHRYFSGEVAAPVLTVFIGGNHEASNYMQELFYGGWVSPNIYYLGCAGSVLVNGLRIAGLSGIYNEPHYERNFARRERPPYTSASIRSVYHVRPLQVAQLAMLRAPVDIFLSHDWPRYVARFGDTEGLLRRKRFLRREVEDGSLGSAPAEVLLRQLRPRLWFSAHMHVRFEAVVPHAPAPASAPAEPASAAGAAAAASADAASAGAASATAEASGSGSASVAAAAPAETRFLALDKCLPGRKFLEVVEAGSALPAGERAQLALDPEWLRIVRVTHPFVAHLPVSVPPLPELQARVAAAEAQEQAQGAPLQAVPVDPAWFVRTAEPYAGEQPAKRRRGALGAQQPPQRGNPQTDRFLARLGLQHVPPVTIPAESAVAETEVARSRGAVAPALADDNEIDIGM